MSEARYTGGCQCGAIRYALHAELDQPSICHCRMCQKAFGSYFAPLGGVMLADFEVTRGTISYFRSSDAVERGFCSRCGTPLIFRYLGADKTDVSLGSLDDPAAVKPIVQFGIEGRMPWLAELTGLPGHLTEDDGEPGLYTRIAATNHQHPDHDTAVWPLPEGGVR